MKSKKIINLKNTLPVMAGAASYVLIDTNVALAASTGVGQIDNGLNIVKGIGIGVCCIIGIIAFVKGVIDLSSGIPQRDQSGIITGGLECASGLIMGFASVIVGLMGF